MKNERIGGIQDFLSARVEGDAVRMTMTNDHDDEEFTIDFSPANAKRLAYQLIESALRAGGYDGPVEVGVFRTSDFTNYKCDCPVCKPTARTPDSGLS